MKRFSMYTNDESPCLEEDPDGDIVRMDDVESVLNDIRNAVNASENADTIRFKVEEIIRQALLIS